MQDPKQLSREKRRQVSKENIKEYDNEKRAKELARRGFNEGAVGGMMDIPESHARKLMKHRTNEIVLDGEL